MGAVDPSDGNRRPTAFGVSIAMLVMATLFVGLRFTSKVFIVKQVRQSDYWMLLAWVVDFGFTFSLLYALHMGLGLHEQDIKPENRAGLNRAVYAFTVLYNPALMTVKTAILVFYLTLTRAEKGFLWATYVTLFVVNAAGIVLTFINVFQCSPINAAFSLHPPSTASCIDIIALYLCSIPVNIVTDVAILCLPMPILSKVRLPRRQKIPLLVIFGCGIFVTVIDVVRIVYLQSAATSRQLGSETVHIHVQNADTVDLSWHSSLSYMWSVVEVNMSIICGCAPSLKPLVSHILPKMMKSSSSGSKSSSNAQVQPKDDSLAMDTLCHSAQHENIQSGCADISRDRSFGSAPSALHENYRMPSLRSGPSADSEAFGALSGDSHTQPIITFDFVQFKKARSMLELNNKESIPPIILVTTIYWLWGFSYGLLGTLGTQLQGVLKVNGWGILGIHSAYYAGYFISPLLIGRFVLKKWGYTSTFITGLLIYAVGALIFWPSAVLTSYPAFLVSSLIVGAGLGILETSADSFLALCGPLENSEIRLNTSQGIQAVATVVSTLLARKVLFKTVNNVPSLVNVQWTYLSIAFFNVALAAAVFYLPVPEAPDADLEKLANRRRVVLSQRLLGVPVVWVTLVLGIFSIYLYVAGQEILATSFQPFVEASHPNSTLSSADFITIGQSLFAIGRFLTALTLCFLKPRFVLLISYTGMITFSALCTRTSGLTAVSTGLMVYLFESGVFGTIFAISLRGMGRHTKTAATLLASAIGGGAFLPFAQYGVSLTRGVGYSYSVLVAVVCVGAVFPLYLNFVPAARAQVDPVRGEYIPRRRRRSTRVEPSVREVG